MNGRLWVCVMAGVLVAHLALIVIIANVRNLGRPAPKPAGPAFMSSTLTFVDQQGRKIRERSEYTVSTELVNEAALKKLAPAPVGSTDGR